MFAAAGLIALIAILLGAIARRHAVPDSPAARASALAIVTGVAALVLPAYGIMSARRVPPIHDITTDLGDPPRFQAAVIARGDNANPVPEAIDPAVAAQHRHAYADLKPLILAVPPKQAFDRAARVARRLRWNVLDADAEDMRIEATATTTWFGFRDDVVIRVRPHENGSRIDIRSTSRVGKSDAGQNANRIRRFQRLMQSPA